MISAIEKKLIVFMVIFSAILSVYSQTDKEKEKQIYDSLTYYYYNIGMYDSVIDIGKEAIYKGFDFYYLRMRMGLAYDNQGNYRLAERHYSEALHLVPSDVNAAYYKYYAALNGRRDGVAYAAFKDYNTEQRKSIVKIEDKKLDYLFEDNQGSAADRIKVKAFAELSLTYGYSFTGNQNKLEDIFQKYDNILYSTGNIRTSQSFFNLKFKGNISPMIQWHFEYNNNRINGENLLQPNDLAFQSSPVSITQNEFYAAFNLLNSSGWNVNISGQILNYKSYLSLFDIDTTIFHTPETPDTILIGETSFKHLSYMLKGKDYVLALSVGKKIGLFDLALFGSYSDIIDRKPVQFGGEITILPKGNYSLYLTNRLIYYSDDISHKMVYKVKAGAALTKKLSFDAAATFGDLQYVNEPNSSVVYNWSEKTTFKGDLTLTYQLLESVYLSLSYQITQKQSLYNYYLLSEYLPSKLPSYYYPSYEKMEGFYKYNQHFVMLGLSWYLY